MKYLVNADVTRWPGSGARIKPILPYNDYADCFGKLEIYFSYQGSNREYKNVAVNVPLFLSEIEKFIILANSDKPQHWYLGFAPFAYGLLCEGSLLISARTGKAFSDSIYDITAPNELVDLKARISKDITRYGKVEMSSARADKVVNEF